MGSKQLCSWAGLTPRHRESDRKVKRGRVTKQGSKLVRWAAIEAVAHLSGGTKIQRDYHRIADRRGVKKAKVAAARRLLTLVYYGLRDGEIAPSPRRARRGEPDRAQPERVFANRQDPHASGAVEYVIEPAQAVAEDHHAPSPARRDARQPAQPACATSVQDLVTVPCAHCRH